MLENSDLSPSQIQLIRMIRLPVVFIVALVVVFIAMPDRISWDFLTNLHLPSQVLLSGESAYDNSITGYPPGVWFPQIIGQFFWLGLFSFEVGAILWLALMVFSFVIGLYLVLPRFEPFPLLVIFMITAAIFPPVWVHYYLGQVSLYLLLLIVLMAQTLEQQRWIALGLLLALASGKPQVLIFPVIGIIITVWRLSGWRGLLNVGGFTLLFNALLLIPLFVADATWFNDYWTIMSNFPAWERPSFYFILLRHLDMQISALIFAPVFVIGFILNVRVWLTLPVRLAMLWSAGLNLVAIPLVWTWDFVVLLPLYGYYLFTLKSITARVLLVTVYLSTIVGFAAVHLTLEGGFTDDWWIPIVMLSGIVIAIQLDQRLYKQDKQQEQDNLPVP